ncbi:helix-turn-helix domain-containing protein [Tsukamurella sp. 1534]|uniref:helix-turn-helix domain-containing protein n=1 Tax=Tsukamurella sp. 1534 TaxID=1151061 RepID=UPI0002FD737E|nr:helix-turn-helix domain-containing protein [Tsukamurella sp. 1534]
MPKVPEPTPQEVRDFLSPISHWSHLKANAEEQYRKTILAAYAARIPIVHIARYTGTSPQAVKKVIDRQNDKAADGAPAFPNTPRTGYYRGQPMPPRSARAV